MLVEEAVTAFEDEAEVPNDKDSFQLAVWTTVELDVCVADDEDRFLLEIWTIVEPDTEAIKDENNFVLEIRIAAELEVLEDKSLIEAVVLMGSSTADIAVGAA
jgi:hypothetical protein